MSRLDGTDGTIAVGDLPIHCAELELTQPMVDLEAPPHLPHARTCWTLVRHGGTPLGYVVTPFVDGRVAAIDLLAAVDEQLGPVVRAGRTPAPSLPEGAVRPLVSVVVPTVGLTDTLVATVRAILEGRYRDIEVVVVDNRPTGAPTVRDAIAALADERVTVIDEPARGASNARNAGLAASHGSIVAFADDDVRCDRNWLAAIVGVLHAEPTVACVTGPILPDAIETIAQARIEQFGGHSNGFVRRTFGPRPGADDSALYPYAAGVLGSGANAAFRRTALDEIGGFDPALGPGTPTASGEDLDLLARVVLAGHHLVYSPDPIVFHDHHREMPALRRQIFGYGIGLTAYLTKQLCTSGRARREIPPRALRGLRYALGGDSTKNAGKGADYPRSLTLLELAGMALGPGAYLRSRMARYRRDTFRPL